MLFIGTATRQELETAVVNVPGLWEALNEEKLLNGSYETEELREAIGEWIEAGDETAAC